MRNLISLTLAALSLPCLAASFVGAWNGDLLMAFGGYFGAAALIALSVFDPRPLLETVKIVIAFTMVLTGRIGRWAEAGKWVVGREAGVVFFRRVA